MLGWSFLDGVDPFRPSKGKQQKDLEAKAAAFRSACFDQLRKLQDAVRAIVLTATMNSFCVRCSDSQCMELFRLIRSCLLAGCLRFVGTDFAVDDLVFLLIVPEFMRTFNRDLDFIAYLCTNHSVATFVQQLFGDASRIAKFYLEGAIMRDEELNVAFVSSLLALEPVTFHADLPDLAQQCLSASLDDLRLSPEPRNNVEKKKKNISKTDLAAIISTADATANSVFSDANATAKSMFSEVYSTTSSAFAMLEKQKSSLPKCVVQVDPTLEAMQKEIAKSTCDDQAWMEALALATASATADVSASENDGKACVDTNIEKDKPEEDASKTVVHEYCAADHVDFTTFVQDSLEQLQPLLQGLEYKPWQPLLHGLHDNSLVLALEELDMQDVTPSVQLDVADAIGQMGDIEHKFIENKTLRQTRVTFWESSLSDAFGLDAGTQMEPIPGATLSFRDFRGLGEQQRRNPIDKARLLIQNFRSDNIAKKYQAKASYINNCNPLFELSSASAEPGCDNISPEGSCSGDEGDDTGDEANDAVALLEQVWETTRKENARRLLKTVGGIVPLATNGTLVPTLLENDRRSNGSTRETPVSSVVATPRGSNPDPLVMLRAGLHDDAMSDTGSEPSSNRSVSSASLLGIRPPVLTPVGQDSEPNPACASRFGLHLEWQLQMKPRPQQSALLVMQGGCCLGCQERLPPSPLNNWPYCHYTVGIFCNNCHQGDLRVIPARVVERWDFQPRRVSSIAAKFLDAQAGQPLISITRIRRTKVASQAVLTEVHMLRQQLTRIQNYALECGCPFLESVGQMVSFTFEPHIASGHDLYTLRDLLRIELEGAKCQLFINLQRLVTTAVEHLQTCEACRASGHYCLICASRKAIFTFEIDKYQECSECGTAYHRVCFQRAGSECPKCLRLQASTGRPSLSELRPR